MTDKEAIEILKEFKKYFEAEAIQRQYSRNISITVGEDDIEAIDTILLSYEVLWNELDKKNKEIEELKKITNEYHSFESTMLPENTPIVFASSEYFHMGYFSKKNYIPKQKIQEKIDELKGKSGGNIFHIQQTINAEIRLLEELLKGEDE